MYGVVILTIFLTVLCEQMFPASYDRCSGRVRDRSWRVKSSPSARYGGRGGTVSGSRGARTGEYADATVYCYFIPIVRVLRGTGFHPCLQNIEAVVNSLQQ